MILNQNSSDMGCSGDLVIPILVAVCISWDCRGNLWAKLNKSLTYVVQAWNAFIAMSYEHYSLCLSVGQEEFVDQFTMNYSINKL